MKIAWCTPFSVRSAIGGVSGLVVDALRGHQHVEVDLWYPRGTGGRSWPDEGHELGSDAAARLAEYDAVVYNIGDQPDYHGPLLDLSHQVPGMVVLHDLSLVHLMFNRLLAVQEDYFVATMQRWYGDEGARAAQEGVQHRGEWLQRPETVQQFPMTEAALESATSVVTHSRYAADALAGRYVGEVTVLPLPVAIQSPLGAPAAELAIPDDRVMILQAGVLNPNKHVDVVLEAIAEAELADEVHLVVCGHAVPRELEQLKLHIADLGLQNSTTVLGEVSDATLHALRSRADIGTVLRHPCGEAASAVLAESLGHGIPLVSVDDGCYREAPAESVLRVPVPPDPADVGAALRRWVEDPEARATAAERGREFVREQHSAAAYASGILDALQRTGATRRRAALAQDLADITARAGFDSNSSLVDRLAERAHELFAATPNQLSPTLPPTGGAPR